MRAYTCLALGFLVGACGPIDSRESLGQEQTSGPPPFSGQLATGGSNDPGQTDEMAAAASPDTNTISSSAGAGNEGNPDVTQLEPSEPPAGGGSGGAGMGPQGTAGGGTAGAGAAGGGAAGGGAAGGGAAGTGAVPPDEPPPASTQVFVLFGQSNMWGVPNPQAVDLEINPRVEVLTMTSCGRHGTNQWVPAQPPLHGCVGQAGTGTNGPGVGPGDYFGKALAAAFPEDTILLVPNAIPGVSIDVFQPGQAAYNSTLARARMAQQRGEIRGIIFHQGETDSGQSSWPGRVKTVVDRLRSDLGVGEVPFVAGELFRGCPCAGHNSLINQLPNTISNAFVVSSEGGFAALPNDGFGNLHFDLAAQRTFGRRYGEVMLDALGF